MKQRLPWIERTPNVRAAKLGTILAVVQVHGSDVVKLAPGNWIRVREIENGPWTLELNERGLQVRYVQAEPEWPDEQVECEGSNLLMMIRTLDGPTSPAP